MLAVQVGNDCTLKASRLNCLACNDLWGDECVELGGWSTRPTIDRCGLRDDEEGIMRATRMLRTSVQGQHEAWFVACHANDRSMGNTSLV